MGKTIAERGTRNAEQTGRCRFPLWVAPFALLFGLGCASDRYRSPSAAVDPMIGGAPLAPGGPSASAVPAPTPVAPVVPPLPVAIGTQSVAALAAGTAPKPLDPTHDLRIAIPVSNPSPGSPQATLLPTSAPLPVARGLAPAGARIASFEQAQAFLTARGVKWQSLQTWGDQGAWKFSCSIPNAKNAYISRTYEAQARDNLSAVQAVIDQIERDGSSGF